jgi:putative DNA primase/helicase
MQPGKIERYVLDALEGSAGDDGLLQRMQILYYSTLEGEIDLGDYPPDIEGKGAQGFLIT